MSRERHHEADDDELDDVPQAESARAEPGKRALTESAPGGATGSAASNASQIKRLKDSVRDAYVGAGKFAQRGILDHKFDAIQDTKDFLNKEDDSIGAKLLVSAVTIGAAVAGGALATTTFGGGILAAALIAGAAATASELPGVLGGNKDAPLDPIAFCSRYRTALRQGWPGSVKKLHERMDTLEEAREVHRKTLSVRSQAGTIKENQSNELLDAWVNALKSKTQDKSTPQSMGSENYGDSTAGRLHIEGVVIDPRGEKSTSIDVQGLRAKLTGVPEDARNQMRGRVVNDIRVARTIEGTGRLAPGGRGAFSHFAFGIHPSGTPRLLENEVTPIARTQLAGIDGADTWQDGLLKIWDRMRNRTLSSLGVSDVEH
jgi:hypothetical protein